MSAADVIHGDSLSAVAVVLSALLGATASVVVAMIASKKPPRSTADIDKDESPDEWYRSRIDELDARINDPATGLQVQINELRAQNTFVMDALRKIRAYALMLRTLLHDHHIEAPEPPPDLFNTQLDK